VVDGGKPGVDSRDDGKHILEERSVIRREDDVDGRASVTRDDERVLRGDSKFSKCKFRRPTFWPTI